ncbi:hypothetical protein FDP41_013484 [Naegleria fowleri]|uniref:F-box domain-containing protein n=1 Tax=Naegleria fowleri TaxID=5763 RepID=A0A6A5C325_NAEFO|nr:uncharacterized protein FDP41_013484 [Naegleria fowleri]KAF0980270.1 hypothetical protein FDP41_013484 [Naegleria fowleri]CAG4715335.1 unnamed protein product [Naegleria fowleri]
MSEELLQHHHGMMSNEVTNEQQEEVSINDDLVSDEQQIQNNEEEYTPINYNMLCYDMNEPHIDSCASRHVHDNYSSSFTLPIDCIEHILSFFRMKERLALSLVSSDWNRAFEKSIKQLSLSKMKSDYWLKHQKLLKTFVMRFPEIQLMNFEAPAEGMRSASKADLTLRFSMDLIQFLLKILPSSLKSFSFSHFACGLSTKSFELIIPEDKQLRELAIINCKHCDNLSIKGCNNLTQLSISWASFFPAIEWNELKNLRVLNLSHNKAVNDEIVNQLVSNCPNLEKLILVGASAIQSPFKDVSISALKTLDLSATNIVDSCIEHICSGSALILVELKVRTCMHLVNPVFKELPSVVSILCNFNSNIQTSSFHKLPSLEKLDLDGNTSLKEIWLYQCKNITYLDISKTLVDDKALAEVLEESPELRELYVIKCYKLKSPHIVHDKLEILKLTNSNNLTKHTVIDCPSLSVQNVVGTPLEEGFFIKFPHREDIRETVELTKVGKVKHQLTILTNKK